MTGQNTTEAWWTALLTGEGLQMPLRQMRRVLALLPSEARCKFCNSPFDGIGAPAMRTIGRGPSRLTTEFCHQCQVTSSKHIGGAEIELTMLFADVRGSTSLAEGMSPSEFSLLISRFFGVTSRALLRSRAWVDRLVGDQVVGMYIPFYVGDQHRSVAVGAAKELLRKTGHGDPSGPWIPLGVGVHTGVAFVGAVGSEDGATDITVLGDAPNVASRLSSAAGPGEVLVSEDTYASAGLPADLERRTLDLKGKTEPLPVRVLTDYQQRIALARAGRRGPRHGSGWVPVGFADFKSVGPGPSVGAVGSTPSRSRQRNAWKSPAYQAAAAVGQRDDVVTGAAPP